jgi:DNA-binding transcriptional ArsR family regulator
VALPILRSILRIQFRELVSSKRGHLAVGDKDQSGQPVYGEKHLRRLLWYLLGGTRGGPNRVEILKALRERPLNANQLAGVVRLDYKTIEHHMRVLSENSLVTSSQKGTYGAVFFLTSTMEEAWPLLEEIWGKIGRTKISNRDGRE